MSYTRFRCQNTVKDILKGKKWHWRVKEIITEFRYDIEVGPIRECKVIVINNIKALLEKEHNMKDQRDTFRNVMTIGKSQIEIP